MLDDNLYTCPKCGDPVHFPHMLCRWCAGPETDDVRDEMPDEDGRDEPDLENDDDEGGLT